MAIKEEKLVPKYYLNRIPICDDCEEELVRQDYFTLTSNPPQYEYVCPKCERLYTFYSNQVQGEWVWED